MESSRKDVILAAERQSAAPVEQDHTSIWRRAALAAAASADATGACAAADGLPDADRASAASPIDAPHDQGYCGDCPCDHLGSAGGRRGSGHGEDGDHDSGCPEHDKPGRTRPDKGARRQSRSARSRAVRHHWHAERGPSRFQHDKDWRWSFSADPGLGDEQSGASPVAEFGQLPNGCTGERLDARL